MYMWGVIYVFEGVIYVFGGVVLTSLHIYIWRCDIWHRLRVWSTPLPVLDLAHRGGTDHHSVHKCATV